MAETTRSSGAWLSVRRAKPFARVRLFCFPYGGRGASLFRGWQEVLPAEVDVCPVQLPGRENRAREAPFTDVRQLAVELATALGPHLTLPFALFGHSLGAFVAFELARRLHEQNGPAPIHLFVSGQRAPHWPAPLPPIFHLPDEEFLDEVVRRYDAVPKIVRETPELRDMLLVLLRADFTMNDTYGYGEGARLTCPITCLGADGDPESREDDLRAWREHTGGRFEVRMFPGGHFFIESARTAVLGALAEDLHSDLLGVSRGAA